MKRKYVLMVPVAAVTLWANSFGTLVSAQSLQTLTTINRLYGSKKSRTNKISLIKTTNRLTKTIKKIRISRILR